MSKLQDKGAEWKLHMLGSCFASHLLYDRLRCISWLLAVIM